MASNNILMPGYLYFDGTKYTTSQDLQGPPGPTGATGPTGPSGGITAGNYVLSGPLSIDGYVTIKYLHTQSGLLSDGYLTMQGTSNVASGATLLVNSGGTFNAQAGSTFRVRSDLIYFDNASSQLNISGNCNFSGIVGLSSLLQTTSSIIVSTGGNLFVAGPFQVDSTGSADFNCDVTFASGTNLFVDADSTFTGETTFNNLITINSDIDGDVDFNGNVDFFGNPSFLANSIFLGPSSFRFCTLPGTTGNILIANSSAGGQFFFCDNTTGGTINKTIVDDGSLPEGTWFIMKNISDTDGPNTNTILVFPPSGPSIIALSPRYEMPVISDPITASELLTAINKISWGLFVKTTSDITSWRLLASGH